MSNFFIYMTRHCGTRFAPLQILKRNNYYILTNTFSILHFIINIDIHIFFFFSIIMNSMTCSRV